MFDPKSLLGKIYNAPPIKKKHKKPRHDVGGPSFPFKFNTRSRDAEANVSREPTTRVLLLLLLLRPAKVRKAH